MSKIRFVDPGIIVNATGGSGGSSISSSYALSASYADFATSASYAVSASHEIIKEVSSSYADTASFAQSGNGIFSGSFSGNGSGLTNIPSSGIIGLPTVTGTTNTIPIFTGTNAIGNSTITYDGESWDWNVGGGVLKLSTSNSSYVSIFPTSNNLRFQRSTGASTEFSYSTLTGNHILTIPSSTGTFALLNSNNYSASGSFSGSFQGDGSELIGVISSSYSTTASYVETAQTASYVLNAVSSSYAITASHLLNNPPPFPFSGSAVITGSLVVSGSSKPLEIIGSGSTVFSVVGSLGELFAIDDQLSGSLLVVNDISGLPQFEVFSDGRTLIGADPRSLYTTATINATLAATSESIYSLSTSSYDGVFFDYTVTSASNARAGNIMSIWNGGNLVYTENTTTDIGSTVGVTFNVEISQSQAQLISLTDTAGWKIKTTIRSI